MKLASCLLASASLFHIVEGRQTTKMMTSTRLHHAENAKIQHQLASAPKDSSAPEGFPELLVETDLSILTRVHFRAFQPGRSIADNANQTFDHLVRATNLSAELTDTEEGLFKERFIEDMEQTAKKTQIHAINSSRVRDEVWTTSAAQAMEQQKPSATVALAKRVNSSKSGWVAESVPWSQNVSTSDVQRLCGAHITEGEISKLQSEKDAEEKDTSISWSRSGRGEEFDGRKQWPKCAAVIGFVRNQGQCGSCWAISAAAVIEDRLCISSNGSFTGQSAAISAGYLASCANYGDRDGCSGGRVDHALHWAAKQGVPTGGDGSNMMTCVPYFGNGDSLKHFQVHGKSPPCPVSCTSDLYPRSIQEDRFYPEGMINALSGSFYAAKEAIRQHGSIAILFPVYHDFMIYRGGIYYPYSRRQLAGYHATVAIGFGDDYILSVNSWDRHWGEQGLFRIHRSAILGYVIPGRIRGTGRGYPYPIPGGGPPPLSEHGGDMFHVKYGRCTVDRYGCVQSPDYPAVYPNGGHCNISVNQRLSGPMRVLQFSTETLFDTLFIDGKAFSGDITPQNITPKSYIAWTSDETITGHGWKLCPPNHSPLDEVAQEMIAQTELRDTASSLCQTCTILCLLISILTGSLI